MVERSQTVNNKMQFLGFNGTTTHEIYVLLHREVAPIMIDHKLLGQVPEPNGGYLYVLIVLKMGDDGIRFGKVSLVVSW
jgi:hypothetical protein